MTSTPPPTDPQAPGPQAQWPQPSYTPPPAPQPQWGQQPPPPQPQWGQQPPPPGAVYNPQAPWNGAQAPASPFNAPQVEATVPAVAWLVPVAALLAVIGVFTPWFKPELSATSTDGQTLHQTFDALYSWKDGKVGLIAPVILVVLAIGVVGLLVGRTPARFTRGTSSPVVSAARGVIIAGVAAMVCVAIAYFMVKSQYTFDGKSWDDALSQFRRTPGVKSADLDRGPQIGLWLTAAAGALAAVAGVLMLVLKGEKAPAGPSLTK